VPALSKNPEGHPSREIELLFLCARTQYTPEDRIRIVQLLKGVENWPKLLKQAKSHGLGALVHLNLLEEFRDYIPQDVLRKMQFYTTCVSLWNESQVEELLRIITLFESNGIAVMPFKGPMLGAFVYGDVGRRTFVDLDLLVRRERFQEVKALLLAEGYTPYRTLEGEDEEAFIKTQMGYEFVQAEKQVVIEVHWAFLNRVHAFNLEPEVVWKRSQVKRYQGVPVRRFSPEDLLIYLCAHGTRSFWEYAVWTCDIAELIRREPQLDWDYVLSRSRELHGERMLFTGLTLAHDLFEADLPEEMTARFGDDAAVARLVRWVKERLFSDSEKPPTFYEKVRIHLAMRERFVDRLPYYAHLAKLSSHSFWKRIQRGIRGVSSPKPASEKEG
jgi:hypothetical protein